MAELRRYSKDKLQVRKISDMKARGELATTIAEIGWIAGMVAAPTR
jgi:hypothetical protein